MGDDGPSPLPEEFQMSRSKFRPVLLQSVDGPHGHIGHYEERYQFPSRFSFRLFDGPTSSEPAVQDEHGLEAGLDEGEYFCGESDGSLGVHGEVAAYEGEHAVYEHAGLCYYQECVVQANSCISFSICKFSNILISWTELILKIKIFIIDEYLKTFMP